MTVRFNLKTTVVTLIPSFQHLQLQTIKFVLFSNSQKLWCMIALQYYLRLAWETPRVYQNDQPGLKNTAP